MSNPVSIDTIKQWLHEQEIAYRICSSCDGLHLDERLAHSQLADFKIELVDSLLIHSLILIIHPEKVITLQAQLNRLSVQVPELKLFIESDETGHQLVAMHSSFAVAQFSKEQFTYSLEQLTGAFGYLIELLDHVEAFSSEQYNDLPTLSTVLLH